MDETLPRCLGQIEDTDSTLWEIKGNERIVVGYLSSAKQTDALDRLFHRECRTYQNNVREHCQQPSSIARIALSDDLVIGGILYDTYMQHESAIVLRDIAVLRAWQRCRVGSALFKSIIMSNQKISPERDFDVFMCVGNEDFETQGFLEANGFKHSRDEREQCQCEAGQLLRKCSVLASRTV